MNESENTPQHVTERLMIGTLLDKLRQDAKITA